MHHNQLQLVKASHHTLGGTPAAKLALVPVEQHPWGAPGPARAPPGVLFGGHKGQFGSWGAPQSVVARFHKLQLIVVHVYSKHFKADIQI